MRVLCTGRSTEPEEVQPPGCSPWSGQPFLCVCGYTVATFLKACTQAHWPQAKRACGAECLLAVRGARACWPALPQLTVGDPPLGGHLLTAGSEEAGGGDLLGESRPSLFWAVAGTGAPQEPGKVACTALPVLRGRVTAPVQVWHQRPRRTSSAHQWCGFTRALATRAPARMMAYRSARGRSRPDRVPGLPVSLATLVGRADMLAPGDCCVLKQKRRSGQTRAQLTLCQGACWDTTATGLPTVAALCGFEWETWAVGSGCRPL